MRRSMSRDLTHVRGWLPGTSGATTNRHHSRR